MILNVCIIYWSIVAVVWTEQDCGQPPQRHGAAFHIGVDEDPALYKGTNFTQGQQIQYRCRQGFYTTSFSGSMSRCENGTWTPVTLQCTELTCGALNPPSNGRRLDDNYNIGSFAMFACNPGYDLQGSSRLLCRVDGEWNPREPPRCTPVKCPDVSYIENGRSFQENWQRPENTYQSVIRYSCDERTGYSIDGDARRVCQADGTWSGRMPQCITPRCPEITLDNGTVTYFGDREVYTLAYFNCRENFDASVANTECELNQQWVEIPKCIPRLIASVPLNGFTKNTELVKNEESYTLHCDKGFVLYDVSRRKFLTDSLEALKVRNMQGTFIYGDKYPVRNLTCEDVRTTPRSPVNGKSHANKEKLFHNENYKAECDEGFLFVNTTTDRFLPGGVGLLTVTNWLGNLTLMSRHNRSFNSLECKDGRCGAPYIRNGALYKDGLWDGFLWNSVHVYNKNTLNHGEQISIKCNGDYRLYNRSSKKLIGPKFDISCSFSKIIPDTLPDCITHPGQVLITSDKNSLSPREYNLTWIRPDTSTAINRYTLNVKKVTVWEESISPDGKYILHEVLRGVLTDKMSPEQEYYRIRSLDPASFYQVEIKAENAAGPSVPAAFIFRTDTAGCEPWQFQCHSGDCISYTTFCDGKPDCRDRSDEKDCDACNTSYTNGRLLSVNDTEMTTDVSHLNIGKVLCMQNYSFTDVDNPNGIVQCRNGVWIPEIRCLRDCQRPTMENAKIEPDTDTYRHSNKITVKCIHEMIAGQNDGYYLDESNIFTCNDGAFDIERHYCKENQDTSKTVMQESTSSPLTTRTASQAVEKNLTSESQNTGSCILPSFEHITYWRPMANTVMFAGDEIANETRVRVQLDCSTSGSQYSDYSNDEVTDESNAHEAEIQCLDGTLTQHGLTCETDPVEEPKYLPNTCEQFNNGAIKDRGRSVECDANYKLVFQNGMDAALYTRNSCKCNQTTNRLQCLGVDVECKPMGCTIPTVLKPGITLFDPIERIYISSANRYVVQHNESVTFNCPPSGNTFYEPHQRQFVCNKGTWLLMQRPKEKTWDMENNGSFPECRQVKCPAGHCKNGGYCYRDNTCQCPKNTTGYHCEPVCRGKCLNGGTCIAPGKCECQRRFSGPRCEIAGCTKPDGNIINLPKDLFFHQETLIVTNSNCESGYYLEEEHKTITCDRGKWSEDVNCERAVCKHACQNGGTCKTTGACECPERFKGAYCETFDKPAGCAKPEGNLVNLKQFYDDGDTIRITDGNCGSEHLPSSRDMILSCKNGHWSDTISCVPATHYKIRVVTANIRGAGTDGDVTIRLKGTEGDTGNIGLLGRFDQNSTDDNDKFLPDVGTITSVDIGVTRRRLFFEGWIPSRVTVHDARRNHFHFFEHDETELDNRSITLARKGCVTMERGHLGDGRRYYSRYNYFNTDLECMMFCFDNNCVQAEYRTSTEYCLIVTRYPRQVTKRKDYDIHVLTPHCV